MARSRYVYAIIGAFVVIEATGTVKKEILRVASENSWGSERSCVMYRFEDGRGAPGVRMDLDDQVARFRRGEFS
jgi:hypothetical protein